ncbi:MAG: lipid A deacylase LpxR family protein [Bacteroidota bacterium]
MPINSFKSHWQAFLLVPVLLLCHNITTNAQITVKSRKINNELHFRYDNDIYFSTDAYYSSGGEIEFRRIINYDSKFYEKFSSKKSDSSKLITTYQYGNKIFTPFDIGRRAFERGLQDRPYAGWHYLRFFIDNFPNAKSVNRYELEVGLVGEASGIGQFHQWWHEALDFRAPRGWENQIANEPVINLGYNRFQQIQIWKKLSIVSETGAKIGNGQNRLSQGFTLRYGRQSNLNNSGSTSSRVSHLIPQIGNSDPEEEEGFLFFGISGDLVLSNIFIQGSIFNDNSPVTRDVERLVISRKFGFMYTNYYVTIYFTYYHLSSEFIGGKVHEFLSLNLALRF